MNKVLLFLCLLSFPFNLIMGQSTLKTIKMPSVHKASISIPESWEADDALGMFAFYGNDQQRFRMSKINNPTIENCPSTVESLIEVTKKNRVEIKVISKHTIKNGVGILFEETFRNGRKAKEYWFFVRDGAFAIFIKSMNPNMIDAVKEDIEYFETINFESIAEKQTNVRTIKTSNRHKILGEWKVSAYEVIDKEGKKEEGFTNHFWDMLKGRTWIFKENGEVEISSNGTCYWEIKEDLLFIQYAKGSTKFEHIILHLDTDVLKIKNKASFGDGTLTQRYEWNRTN